MPELSSIVPHHVQYVFKFANKMAFSGLGIFMHFAGINLVSFVPHSSWALLFSLFIFFWCLLLLDFYFLLPNRIESVTPCFMILGTSRATEDRHKKGPVIVAAWHFRFGLDEEDLRSQNKLFDSAAQICKQQQQQQTTTAKATKRRSKIGYFDTIFPSVEIGIGSAGENIIRRINNRRDSLIPICLLQGGSALSGPTLTYWLRARAMHSINFPWMKWNNLLVRERHKYPDENCDFILYTYYISIYVCVYGRSFSFSICILAIFYFCCRA